MEGYRTYAVSAAGVLTGLGMLVSALATGDHAHITEGLTLMFVSGAQFFQRKAKARTGV